MTRPVDVVCTGLNAAFGPVPVLRGVDLRLREGEQVALLGPSGVGKTTLLRLLVGAVRPVSGRVLVGGLDPADRRLAPRVRRGTGVVRQRDDLVRGLTARANVLIGVSHRWGAAGWLAMLRGGVPKHERQRLAELAERHGIAGLLDSRVEHLSGGQRQRVALVRALLPGPGLLLADEPVSGLDPVRAAEALRHLRSTGATLIVTTHDLAVARQFPRIVALRDGGVGYDGADLDESRVREIYDAADR
jgi:ABC-type multidrug transport system ATPase subunit